MSARPRPVTATVTKPASLSPTHGVKQRKISLSSGTSTESLISVLDHDSYESPLPSENEDELKDEVNNKLVVQQGKHKENKNDENKSIQQKQNSESNTQTYSDDYTASYTDDATTTHTRTSSTQPTTTTTEDKEREERELTAFQKWAIEKDRLRRKQQKEQLAKQAAEKAKEKHLKREREEKSQLFAVKYNNWTEKKDEEMKKKKQAELQRKKTEQENEAKKKEKLEDDAKRKYNEWEQQKKEQRLKALKAEQERREREKVEREEKRKKCEEAFNIWLEQAKTRPRTAPHSFGYTQGKLTGFHDRAAYPTPSFYNPIPWQPIHVPQPSQYRKKKPKRRIRNVDKYF